MARPQKYTVDYFPHLASASDKETLFIMEQNFGGRIAYTFWFKTVEILAKSEKHFIDLRTPEALEFFMAKTYTDDEICSKMLNKLAKLGAIDQDLWKEKIIFSDKFVEGVEQAYRLRKVNPYRKDDIMRLLFPEKFICEVNNEVSNVGNTQIKLNNNKLNNLPHVETPENSFDEEEFIKFKKTVQDIGLENIELERLFKKLKQNFPQVSTLEVALKITGAKNPGKKNLVNYGLTIAADLTKKAGCSDTEKQKKQAEQLQKIKNRIVDPDSHYNNRERAEIILKNFRRGILPDCDLRLLAEIECFHDVSPQTFEVIAEARSDPKYEVITEQVEKDIIKAQEELKCEKNKAL
jgi:hypothetical protein